MQINDHKYRLHYDWKKFINRNGEPKAFYRDGVLISAPFKENGISVFISGDQLRLTSDIGLNLGINLWWSEVLMSSDYSGYVCGLCGNADGNS